jgi:hypothetical protein
VQQENMKTSATPKKEHQNQYYITLLVSPDLVKEQHLHILCVDGVMKTRRKNRLRTQNGSLKEKMITELLVVRVHTLLYFCGNPPPSHVT